MLVYYKFSCYMYICHWQSYTSILSTSNGTLDENVASQNNFQYFPMSSVILYFSVLCPYYSSRITMYASALVECILAAIFSLLITEPRGKTKGRVIHMYVLVV